MDGPEDLGQHEIVDADPDRYGHRGLVDELSLTSEAAVARHGRPGFG